MRERQETQLIQCAAFVVLGLLAGCAEASRSEAPRQRVASTALGVIECQDVAAACLKDLSSDGVGEDCRTDLEACFDDAFAEAKMDLESVGECASEALSCGQEAESVDDALSCRNSFATCVNDTLDLPPLPSDDALNEAMQCERDALECVSTAAEPAEFIECGKTFHVCIAEFLPAAPAAPPISLPVPDLGAQFDCHRDALECVSGATTPDAFSECSTEFQACAGVQAPMAPPCVEALGECVSTSASPFDCVEQAKTCVAELFAAP